MSGLELRLIQRLVPASVFVVLLLAAAPAFAAGALSVEIVNGYNLVVDSNITSPATYGPSAAYIGAKVCNTGDAALSNVFLNTGDYKGGVGSTPGLFPVLNSAGYTASPQITNTGSYSLTLQSDDTPVTSDGTRYIGTLGAGECRTQYWLISYPQCVNVSSAVDTPPCAASIAGGVGPEDDVSLNYDVWATTTTAGANLTNAAKRRKFTMRSEISASANKIWPNTDSKVPPAYLAAIQSVIGWGTLGPDGQPLDSGNPVYPGQRVITTQGIWYDLGNVGQGFDNDGDLVPDQNAWLQPVGDAAAFDADCFRMVNVYGVLIVKLKSGGEQLIPFQNQLYFEHIPDNTGVVGLVYYQFIATDSGCSAAMTPYQEAASGFDNEKFSADFGLSNGLTSGSYGPSLVFTKTDNNDFTTTGSTLTYVATATNSTTTNLGAPDLGVPLVFTDTIPAGTTYVAGSATSNLTAPTGTGTELVEKYTDIDGNVDECTFGYTITGPSPRWVVLYSTNNRATWSTTEPVPASSVTDLRWMLLTTITVDGYHNGTDCVVSSAARTVQTSLPAKKAATLRYQVTVNNNAPPVVCNLMGFSFSGSSSGTTAQDCTLVQGNNSIRGTVFEDDGGTGGTYGNGTVDNGTETGIGGGVKVDLYYDRNSDGKVDSGDLLYGTTTTSAMRTATINVTTTNGSTTATSSSFGPADVGSRIWAATIPAGAVIRSVTGNQAVLSVAASASGTNVAATLNRGAYVFTGLPDGNFIVRVRKYDGIGYYAVATTSGTNQVTSAGLFTPSLVLSRITGTGIPAGATITAYTSASQVTISANATATGTTNALLSDATLGNAVDEFLDTRDDPLAYADKTIGWGDTTWDPNQPLTTPSGILKLDESAMYASLAVSIDSGRANGNDQSLTTLDLNRIDFGFAPPLQLTKTVADTTVAEGHDFNYTITLENRLPSAGVQGPSGCQYTVWANSVSTDSNAQKEFTNPNYALYAPNGQVATAAITNGGLRNMTGTAFRLADQAGSITKVEALVHGYYNLPLSNDALGVTATYNTIPVSTEFTAAALDSYVGPSTDLSPDGAISWDMTGVRPGGGTWSWDDNYSALSITVNAGKNSSADAKVFSLDAIGVRVTTNADCVPIPSTTLDPVPLQDRFDDTLFTYVSSDPPADSVVGRTLQWNDVGPIVAGTSKTVTVTLRSIDVDNLITGQCNTTSAPSTPPPAGSACNLAETAYAFKNVGYADGRRANDDDDKVAVNIAARAELHGVVWRDMAPPNGWPIEGAEPKLPDVPVTLFACTRANGTLETDTSNTKSCTGYNALNRWLPLSTTLTDANGEYHFIGLSSGYYIVQVGDHDGLVTTAGISPYSMTQTGEPLDVQSVTAGAANGADCGTCDNTWGSPAASLNSTEINFLDGTTQETVTGINFGYFSSAAIVYGNIWNDIDGDTTQELGEGGLDAFTVQLWADSDGNGVPDGANALLTTTSDSFGNYSFSITPGAPNTKYVIVVTPESIPANLWVETVESVGGTGSLNNQIPITISAGTINGSYDFGYTLGSSSDIGDSVFYDFDADGLRDPGEDGIPGVTVWLYSDYDRDGILDAGVDELLQTDVTDASGNYLFTGLASGSYIVKVDTTDLPAGSIPTADSDIYAGVIGDYIWLDADGAGDQDAGESGIPGVVVLLYADNGDNVFNASTDALVGSATTNVNGTYRFTGLPAGNYWTWVDTTTLPSSALALTSANPTASMITLATSTSTYLNADAGYSPSSNYIIGDRVWHDVDGDGVQDAGELGLPGIDIVISNPTAGDPCNPSCTVTTDEHGYWYKAGLINGRTYSVNVDDTDLPRDFVATTTDPRNVTIAGADNMDVDFGYRYTTPASSPTGSVSGTVFRDTDADRAFDTGEGMSGIIVNLLDADGYVVATTTTGPTGTFAFNGAFIGQYSVEALASYGTTYSSIFLSSTSGFPNLNMVYDATRYATPDSQSGLSVDGAHDNLLQDFGYRRFLGSIGDTVYQDANANGTQDAGEPGIGNVTVRLWDAVWNPLSGNGMYEAGEETSKTLLDTTSTTLDNPLTTADEGGRYLFSNLPALAAGHYYLVEVVTSSLPNGSFTLSADPGTDGLPCSGYSPSTICDSRHLIEGYVEGNNYLGADFGYLPGGTGYATIGDRVWIDSDGDGVVDSGEPGIDKITVWMDTNNDGTVNWTDTNANGVWDAGDVGERWVITDSDGYYVFTNVADGTYNVKVLTSDPDWPASSGLPVTPTYEARSTNNDSLNNQVLVTVSGGAVTVVNDGDADTADGCTSCNLSVDFGYRYAGTNALSGTVCIDDAGKNGYCGATPTTYTNTDGTAVDTANGEAPIAGIQIAAYRWTDSNGNNTAWSGATIDSGDSFVLVGTATTDVYGNYSFSNLPNDVVLVFGISDTQNLRLTTTNTNTSVEDSNVLKQGVYDGTTTYNGNTVTIVGRQALRLGGDTDDNVKDVDFAFDGTLNGAIANDFGDLPSGYGVTLLAQSGAMHRVTNTSIYLGLGIGTETDGLPSATAEGELDCPPLPATCKDGVTWFVDGNNKLYVKVFASADGWLMAWMDFNADGDFLDEGTTWSEWIIDRPVVMGENTIAFDMPDTIAPSVTAFFSRFRIYASRPAMLSVTGAALDATFQPMAGEVEDYMVPAKIIPTAVEMAEIDAVRDGDGVTVLWQTTMEVDNLGFNIYRQLPGREREKVNRYIILGSAFERGGRSAGPRSFRFTDRNAPEDASVQYWIEDVDLDRTRKLHGPVSPRSASSAPRFTSRISQALPPLQVAPLGDTALPTDSDQTLGSLGGIFTTEPGMGVQAPSLKGDARRAISAQWKLAGDASAKVLVTRPGWVRVTKAALVAAGFDPGTNTSKLAVTTDGLDVPAIVTGSEDGRFDDTDTIEFFGQGLDTPGSGARTYYVASAVSGKRVQKKSTPSSRTSSTRSFTYTFERIERTVFEAALTTNGERENFLGAIVSAEPVTQTVTATNRATSGTARIEIEIQGVSEMQHVIEVQLNGSHLGQATLFDKELKTFAFTVPASSLLEGENTLAFAALNGDEDVSTITAVRLAYPHAFTADENALMMTVRSGGAVQVQGFTSDDIRVVDLTDPNNPFLLTSARVAAGGNGSTKSVTFTPVGAGNRVIFAFAGNRVQEPAQVVYNRPSRWNAVQNAADLVIVTHGAFTEAANTLKTAREAEGLETAVVDVEDLYDEFSFGVHSPYAIRDFFARAQFWRKKPRYAVLLGDASFDPRNYLDMGSYDFVPTKLVATKLIKTASDDWFGDPTASGNSSIAIGRLPARTAEQAEAIVQKLVSRSVTPGSGWANRVELVADWENGFPFDWAADQVEKTVPESFDVGRISIQNDPSATQSILQSFNDGALVTQYIGHGSTEIWSDYVFTSSQAAELTNSTALPFVVAMDCLNGYFHDLWTWSLGEALLQNPSGGAIGAWVSSGSTHTLPQIEANKEFNRRALSQNMTIGDAIQAAKRYVPDKDIRRTWILLGDPSMKLR